MKKITLYRQASWIADSYLSSIDSHIESLQAMDVIDEDDYAALECYKAMHQYFSNMEFLKSIRV